MLPGGVNEIGVVDDLLYLGLGAVSLYVGLLEYLVEIGVLLPRNDTTILLIEAERIPQMSYLLLAEMAMPLALRSYRSM
jgi:ABC-type enterochelin transport system permease subunit